MKNEEESESDNNFETDNNSENYEYNDIDLTTDVEDFQVINTVYFFFTIISKF